MDTNTETSKTKRFTKNDSGFICINCKKEVAQLKYTSRNHCPNCLFSLHVDVMPGDRQNSCGGILEPLFSEPTSDLKNLKKGYVITFKCNKCGKKVRNRAAADDDKELLINLTNPENYKNK